MSDLDMGMNQWMTQPFRYPDKPMDRGKILWEDDLNNLPAKFQGHWGRYLDVDGDGIAYRTVMGNMHPRSSYFARGTGHDEYSFYSEEPDVWERLITRLGLKYKTAKQYVPRPVVQKVDGAKFGIIAFGSSDPGVE